MKRYFSVPSRALPFRDMSHLASPHSLPGNSYKHLDDTRVGTGHVTACSEVMSAFPQWRNNRRTLFSHVSDQGFIGETEAHVRVVFSEFSAADSCGIFVVGEDLIVWIGDFVWAVFSWVIVQFSSVQFQMRRREQSDSFSSITSK
jgi:hypothetical protein